MSTDKPNPALTLTPELKAWIDRVIVPALVDQYLAERASGKELEPELAGVAECAATGRQGRGEEE